MRVEGLIPACAGKTDRLFFLIDAVRAHPRVCGENFNGVWQTIKDVGSSPRVRGKRVSADKSHAEMGLIPACAGKTWARFSGCSEATAHPRVCGENRRC